jgi:hypothetical protein
VASERARLGAGSGLPGTGVFLYSARAQPDGGLRGARFVSFAFVPLFPLGMVRLVPRPEQPDVFELGAEGAVPLRDCLRVFAKSVAVLGMALAPAAWILPRIHETGAVAGLRLVAATLLPLAAMAAADLSIKRISRLPLTRPPAVVVPAP